MVLGLRTVIYHVPNLDRAKKWYSEAFGIQPYFDEPFYVGFNIGGFELGLDPDTKGVQPGPGGTVAYWGVANAEKAVANLNVPDATKKFMAIEIWIHLDDVLSDSMHSGDVSVLKCIDSKYLSVFAGKLQKANELLDEANQTPAEQKRNFTGAI